MIDREKIIDGLEMLTYKCSCTKCKYCKFGRKVPAKPYSCDLDDYEIMNGALELLKEQEAVEPVMEQESMVCGVCGHEIIWQRMLGDNIWSDEHLDYCPHCGRKVKWDE